MVYNILVFKHALGIVLVCVATSTLTACVANPPPPVEWRDTAIQRGRDLGFSDPQDIDGKLEMYKNGCRLVQQLDTRLIESVELRRAKTPSTDEAVRLTSTITPDEINKELKQLGCTE